MPGGPVGAPHRRGLRAVHKGKVARVAPDARTHHDHAMTSVRRQEELPGSRSSAVANGADDLRRMVLLLETADVLERRARRTSDPAQVAVLMRRADQRRREANALRERLAARGAALNPQQAATLLAPNRPRLFRPASPAGRRETG